jgi:hypothetical protein
MADSKFVTNAAGYPCAFGICSVSMESTNLENKTIPSDTQWRIDYHLHCARIVRGDSPQKGGCVFDMLPIE